MSDEELVQSFEAGVAPPAGFHHREHVRVAWYYLRQHSWPAALERLRTALQRFAAAQGAPDRYHETMTAAFVLIINERLDDGGRELMWDAFAERNPDLFAWPSVLDRYYRPETLASDRARRRFVFPDRCG